VHVLNHALFDGINCVLERHSRIHQQTDPFQIRQLFKQVLNVLIFSLVQVASDTFFQPRWNFQKQSVKGLMFLEIGVSPSDPLGPPLLFESLHRDPLGLRPICLDAQEVLSDGMPS
jgi:hypothetical protein